jgi:predicted flavoprotein YhiN
MASTDLIIIGGGAAGLMAGVAAGEAGLRAVILERCPKPGRKLLMCGNNRCNLTTSKPTREFLADYGDPVGSFLEEAITAFPPDKLRNWCHKNGLVTKMQRDKRVYPQSERAIDVHHLFTDLLAKYGIGIMLNSPVQKLETGFKVSTANLELTAKYVLVATGGVSYPKTGSVGDGQKMAAALGHKVLPYRPGLAGFNLPQHNLRAMDDITLTILSNGKPVAETRGALEIEKYGISGPAVINACRIISRQNLQNVTFEIRGADTPVCTSRSKGRQECLPHNKSSKMWKVKPNKPRPLKETMTTVGGVTLDEVNPQTMESKKVPGLHFAGEVLDVDGPCGGYNLQGAFSTARLAIESISKNCPSRKVPSKQPPKQKSNRFRGSHKKHKKAQK